MKKILLVLFLLSSQIIFAQVDAYRLGSSGPNTGFGRGLFDYSDPTTINMEVYVWGALQQTGKYIVPIDTDVKELISLAGGPNDNTDLDDIRIYRKDSEGKEILLKFDLSDLVRDNTLTSKVRYVPKLLAKDILIIPSSVNRDTFEWIQFILSFVTTGVGIALLVIRLTE